MTQNSKGTKNGVKFKLSPFCPNSSTLVSLPKKQLFPTSCLSFQKYSEYRGPIYFPTKIYHTVHSI